MKTAYSLWMFFERVLRVITDFFLGILGKNINEQQWQTFLQFIKFCMVGISNTAISLIIYYVFILIDKELYIAGNIIGFIVSVLNSYFLNSKFVFRKEDERGKTIVKTFSAYGVTLILGTVLLYIFVDLLYISEFIAPLINLIVTIPVNFLLNKFWVMK